MGITNLSIVRLTKLPATRLRVRPKQFVDDRVEVHQAGVFSKVVFRFPQEHIHPTITTLQSDLPGLCQGLHDIDLVKKSCRRSVCYLYDADETGNLPAIVGASGGNG